MPGNSLPAHATCTSPDPYHPANFSPTSSARHQVRLEDVVLGQYRSRNVKGSVLPGYLDDDTVPPNRWEGGWGWGGRGREGVVLLGLGWLQLLCNAPLSCTPSEGLPR